MKLLSGLLGAFLLALILAFALSNRQSVTVGLWPFTTQLDMPLYLAALLPLLLGILAGGLAGWLRSLPLRLRARRLKREIRHLHDRIDDLQRTVTIEPARK